MYQDPRTGNWFGSKRDHTAHSIRQQLASGELRLIEGFSRYTIMPNGEVWNVGRARPVQASAPTGYRLVVQLTDDTGRRVNTSLARIVALHFLPPPPDDGQYYDVAFKDDDFANVDPSNLYWRPRWKSHVNPDNYDIDL